MSKRDENSGGKRVYASSLPGGQGPKFFPLKSRNCVCTVILLMWNMPILTNVQIKDKVDMVTK